MSDTARHEELVPMGCQVSSKGRFRFCRGFGPEWITGGRGAYVWDEKDRRFLDWTCGLGALTIGHEACLVNGEEPACYPLPAMEELDLAEQLHAWIPCAQQVRFLKSGTDATTAAVRMARVATGRGGVLSLGSYHGWADWSLDDTKKGCPESVRMLTRRADRSEATLDLIHGTSFAAVILEPVSLDPVDLDWLRRLREACTKAGTVLIFDEVITGIRMARGGAQEVYGVIPDLCAIGKGLANGWPIAAVCGTRAIMSQWSDTHISGTHFGEPTAMFAALECLRCLEKQDFWKHQEEHAGRLQRETARLVSEFDLTAHARVVGHPHWWCLQIPDAAEQTLWQQECIRRGILSTGSHFITLSHNTEEVDATIAAYSSALMNLRDAIDCNEVRERLQCQVNQTVFRRN